MSSRRIAFSRDSTKALLNLRKNSINDLVLLDLARNQATDLGNNFRGAALNVDGSLAACLTTDPSSPGHVVLIDFPHGVTNLISVSVNGPEPANGLSFLPLITPDGRFVIFASRASDLVAGDTNAASDSFVRDRQTDTTLLVSQSTSDGPLAGSTSGAPILGRDGRTLLFASFASNLAERDFNQASDLFLIRLPGAESGFRVLRIGRLSTGDVTLIWAAQPGASYQVQYKDTVDAAWRPLSVPVQIQGNQASAVDTTAAGRFARFYRVVQFGQ